MKCTIKKAYPIIGEDSRTTCRVDFDNTPLKKVKYWAFRALEWFKHDHLGKLDLEGFVILRSSRKNYHLLFNHTLSWRKNLHVVAWIAQQSKNKKISSWLLFQCIKESSTFRIGRKGKKKAPRVVFRYGKQDNEIKDFLVYLRDFQKLEARLREKKR